MLLFVGALPSVVWVTTLTTLVAMGAFVAVDLAVGHAMSGPDTDHSVVLAIACANRNPAIAIATAANLSCL